MRRLLLLERSRASRRIGAVLAVALAAGCVSEKADDSEYGLRLEAARVARDVALRSQPDPVADDLKDTLLPLVYFAPDPSYNVPAALKRSADARPLQMVYSDGVIRDVRRVGELEFTLKGQLRRLSAFVEVGARDADSLFVPFGDLTNGGETYRAGRLLDLHRAPSGNYALDFNLAYNPACYFNPRYSCPIAPKENQLPIEIPAGERVRPK